MKVLGTVYKTPCAVLLGVTDTIHPKFGALQDILIDKEEVFFCVKLYKTITFSEHFNAFVVKLSDESDTINQRDLCSFIPLHARKIGLTTSFQRAIILKHHISTI